VGVNTRSVMPGLVPGIHVSLFLPKEAWMAGTSQDKPGHDGEHQFAGWPISLRFSRLSGVRIHPTGL